MKTVGGLVLVVAVVTLVVGPVTAWTTVRGLGQRVKGKVEESKPVAQLAAEIEVLIDDMVKESEACSKAVAEASYSADTAERQVAILTQKKADNDGILLRAREMLKENKEFYNIGSRRYTRKDIEADSLCRLDATKELQTRLDETRADLVFYQKEAQEAQSLLFELERERASKSAELKKLQVDETNAQRRAYVQELRRNSRRATLNPNSELARKFETLRRHVWAAQQRAEMLSNEVRGGTVDWSGVGGRDPQAEIEAYFATTASTEK